MHQVCEDVDNVGKQKDVLLLLCHLFCRIPCSRYKNKDWLQNVVHPSPSVVLLPRLPERAEQVLRGHSRKTLDIFQTYVGTFVDQHLKDTPDDMLPFTKRRIGPKHNERVDLSTMNIPLLPATTIRSPFTALSGFDDNFVTIHELCETVRAGVFLEKESIPYIPIYPDETNDIPFNAYILDFLKHGDMEALVHDNGIKRGDVWFRLKDFSLVLATIVTSLANYLEKSGADFNEAAMCDVKDIGDILKQETGAEQGNEDIGRPGAHGASSTVPQIQKETAKIKRKERILDSWEDEDVSDDERETPSDAKGMEDNIFGTPASQDDDDGRGLVKVYKAFMLLQHEFNEKFRKVWA